MGVSPPRFPSSGMTPEVREYLDAFVKYVVGEFKDRIADNTGRDKVLLIAPNNSVWALSVDNTGALVTTKVFG